MLYLAKTTARHCLRLLVPAFAAANLFFTTTGLHAGLVIANESFELNGGANSPSLTSWTIFNSGSGGIFAQTGTGSPAAPPNGAFPVPAPTAGRFAAMTNQTGPGTHLLYQDFVVPFGIAAASLDFDFFIGNRDGVFTPGRPLDHTGLGLNQQARVDILTASSPVNSIAAADVLLNIYQTQAGDPLVAGYFPINNNLTSFLQIHQGETLRLRFAEVDNGGFFQMGVDRVLLDVSAIPEPGTLGVGLAIIGACLTGARRRGTAAARRQAA